MAIKVRPLDFINFVNRANVGMVQGRGSASFAAETLDALMILSYLVWQEFQGHEAAQAYVLGLVTTPMPPPPNLSTIR